MISCSRPPEQQFLTQFFRAAKGRDNTTVGRMSAVTIDPREQGTVEDFSIENVGAETRTPLTFKPLFEAEDKAKQEERAFLDTKIAYQTANIKAIEEVLKIEADEPGAEVHPGAAEDHGRVEQVARRHCRSRQGTTAAATAEIKRATGVAEASLTQPGQPALDREDVRRRDDQEGRDGEGELQVAGRPDVRQDARDHDRARRRRRPRRPADYYEDYRAVGRYRAVSFANFARSVFVPTDTNFTTSFWSSSRSSTLTTVPGPNCACDTRAPGRSPGV